MSGPALGHLTKRPTVGMWESGHGLVSVIGRTEQIPPVRCWYAVRRVPIWDNQATRSRALPSLLTLKYTMVCQTRPLGQTGTRVAMVDSYAGAWYT